MLYDGITLTDTSALENFIIASGTSDADGSAPGELFYRTDLQTLRVYDGSAWSDVGSAGAVDFDGLNVKAAVRAATTANITLSGAQTIDGVSVIAGDRVLVKNQSSATANGIYVCAAGAWSRSSDFDGSPAQEVRAGDFTFVTEGTTNGDTGWILTTNGTITIGSTALTFAQFTGSSGVTSLTDTYIGYGSGANVLTGSSNFTFTSGSNPIVTLGLGQLRSLTSALSLRPAPTAAADGPDLNLDGGPVTSGSGAGGAINVSGGATTGATGAGGAVNISGGNGTGSNSVGGQVRIDGGDSAGSGPGANVSIEPGRGGATGAGGALILSGGQGGSTSGAGGEIRFDGATSDTAGGTIRFRTATTTTLVERFRILANGAWSIGSSGTDYGTAGYVLTSNGNAAPTWQVAPASVAAGSNTHIQYNSSGVLAGTSNFTFTTGSNTLAIGNPGTSAGVIAGADSATGAAATMNLTVRAGNGTSGNANGSGRLILTGGAGTGGAGGGILLQTASSNTLADRLTIDNNGNIAFGAGALNTTATNGHVYFTSSAGVPTGVPSQLATFAGRIPVSIDSTNNDLYFYTNSAWRKPFAAPAGSTTQIQYNNAGVSAGASGITTNGTNLTITGATNTLGPVQGVVTAVAASAIDCSLGNHFTKTAAGANTWTFTNVPSTRHFIISLRLVNGGTGVQTWPASVKWPGGVAPTLTVSGTDVLLFMTDDAGTNFYGAILLNYS